MELEKLIGLKVLALKGLRTDGRKKKNFVTRFILFDDEKTFIELDDQDYFTYHDCATSAKHINVIQNKQRWKQMMENKNVYPDADLDIVGW